MALSTDNMDIYPYSRGLPGGLKIHLGVRNRRNNLTINEGRAEVYMVDDEIRTDIGMAFVRGLKDPKELSQNSSTQLTFILPLDRNSLSIIEDERKSRNLKLRLKFILTGGYYGGGAPGHNMFVREVLDERETIHKGRWVEEFLERFGYGTYETWRVRFPDLPHRDALAKEVELLDRAIEDYNKGDYEDCYRDCRNLVESLEARTNRDELKLGEFGASKQFTRAKGYLSVALHSEEAIPRRINRHDAELAISLTGALYRRVAQALDEE